MNELDFSAKVPQSAVTVLGLCMIVTLIVAMLTYLFVRRAYPRKYKGTFLGMATYFLTVYVALSLVLVGVKYLFDAINAPDNFATAMINIKSVISLLLQMAIVVLCIEFSLSHFGYNPGDGSFGNILAFGFGFSLINVLRTVVEYALNYWLVALSINATGLEAYFSGPACEGDVDKYNEFLANISYIFEFGAFHYIWVFLEVIISIAFTMTLVVLISFVVRKKMNKTFLVTVMGIYLVYYMPSLLNVLGVITLEFIVMFAELVICAAVIIFTWQLQKTLTPDDYEHMDEIRRGGVYEALFASRSVKKAQPRATGIAKAAALNSTIKERQESKNEENN